MEWFREIKPSPQKLLESMNIRFKGASKQKPPIVKFYGFMSEEKHRDQSWEELVLQLQHLASVAELDENTAYNSYHQDYGIRHQACYW